MKLFVELGGVFAVEAEIRVPGISIALATFNGQKYLGAQLDSITRQTVLPSELVVFDDRSSDATMAILLQYSKTAPFPVRIHRNRSQHGYRVNFIRAAAACRSELIAFCDQDDVWRPNKLSTMTALFEANDILLAFHNATLIDELGTPIGTMFYRAPAKTIAPLKMRPWTIIPGHAQMIRRSLLRLMPLYSRSLDPYSPGERMPHDQWYPFWASILGHIAYTPAKLAEYRLHGNNVSGWPTHLFAFVVDHIVNAERYIAGNAAGARNRLELIRRCRSLLTPKEGMRVDAAISYYEEISSESDQRFAIYQGKTFAARTRALISLLRKGTYNSIEADSLGPDAFLLDAFVGLPSLRIRQKN